MKNSLRIPCRCAVSGVQIHGERGWDDDEEFVAAAAMSHFGMRSERKTRKEEANKIINLTTTSYKL